jgi:hypothetical protein
MSEAAAVGQVEDWEFDAPAHLQCWPAHVHPAGPGSWDRPRLFSTLREAIATAVTDPDPPGILTSGGHTLRALDVETLWLDQKAAEASGRAESPPS